MNKQLLYALIGVIGLVLSYMVYERYFAVVDLDDDIEEFSKKSKKWGWVKCRKYNSRVIGGTAKSLTSLRKFTKDNRNKYHPSWGERQDTRIKHAENVLEKRKKIYKDRC
jgi:hypothetical protein